MVGHAMEKRLCTRLSVQFQKIHGTLLRFVYIIMDHPVYKVTNPFKYLGTENMKWRTYFLSICPLLILL